MSCTVSKNAFFCVLCNERNLSIIVHKIKCKKIKFPEKKCYKKLYFSLHLSHTHTHTHTLTHNLSLFLSLLSFSLKISSEKCEMYTHFDCKHFFPYKQATWKTMWDVRSYLQTCKYFDKASPFYKYIYIFLKSLTACKNKFECLIYALAIFENSVSIFARFWPSLNMRSHVEDGSFSNDFCLGSSHFWF